ncbi:MAG: serine/threonine protein phosphatase [Rhizobiaceae bacterium]|nr:serine/threonine protein phosphatase [Rhizobiaceae bacterium]
MQLIAAGKRERIKSVVVDARIVWIKRMDGERPPLSAYLHRAISPLSPWAIFRGSRLVNHREMVEREVRKTAAFANAGFPFASILLDHGSSLVMSDAPGIVQNELDRLKPIDAKAHDRLLIACAAALGRAHQAGLCHGRPHPRDMILDGGSIGFLDFEEAPEEVMPLADAQARDLWLIFLQISSQAILENTSRRALEAYCAKAPATVLPRLSAISGLFGALHHVLRLAQPLKLGSDGRRLLKAIEFLRPALAQARVEMKDKTLPGAAVAGRKSKAMQ